MNGWFGLVRSVLEVLYFAAGIAIAVAAYIGLKQIKVGLEQLRITKQIANTNARREAIKFAAEQCRLFADWCVPAMSKLSAEYKRQGLSFVTPQPEFKIQNGEIVPGNFNQKLLEVEVPKIGTTLVAFLNALEAFAIPFATAVADDDIGYQETAWPFCQGVRMFMPAIFQLRRMKFARYESTVKMYDIWERRLAAHAIAPALKPMEELVRLVESQRVKPLGTDH